MTLGERIRLVRGEHPQREFAKMVEVSQSSYSVYEQGQRAPDALTLRRICEATKVNPEWLLMGTGPMYKDGLSGQNDRRVSREPEKANPQHTENIDSEKTKTTDMLIVLELQREFLELTRRCLRDAEEKAALMVRAERDAARIRELERELEGARRDSGAGGGVVGETPRL